MGPRNGDFEAESLKKKTKTENIKKKTRNDTYGAKMVQKKKKMLQDTIFASSLATLTNTSKRFALAIANRPLFNVLADNITRTTRC